MTAVMTWTDWINVLGGVLLTFSVTLLFAIWHHRSKQIAVAYTAPSAVLIVILLSLVMLVVSNVVYDKGVNDGEGTNCFTNSLDHKQP